MVLFPLENRINALVEWATEGEGKKVSQGIDGLRSQVEILTEDLYQRLHDYYTVLQDDLYYWYMVIRDSGSPNRVSNLEAQFLSLNGEAH